MNCQAVQGSLSLYLYGELEFAQEEELELHLNECAFCQQALAREKSWHTNLSATARDVPLDLLGTCRQTLRSELAKKALDRNPQEQPSPRSWWRWASPFGISLNHWSMQAAMASFLILLGFGAARLNDRRTGAVSIAGARVSRIQTDGDQVRLQVDLPSEIAGGAEDKTVRALLLAAARQAEDPGVRLDAVDILSRQSGRNSKDVEVKSALLQSVQQDANAAVRMRAIAGLSRFSVDPAIMDALKNVLVNDDNAGVRSEAINVLAPLDRRLVLTPGLSGTLQEVMRSTQEDEYVRSRCSAVLHAANVSLVY